MQHLGNLWKAVKLVSSARDLAVETRRFKWDVTTPCTFFLQAEYADIHLSRHNRPQVQAKIELQAGFGWQLTTDQDEAGVYIIARRKPLIGSVGRAKFAIAIPDGVHVSLKLERSQLCMDDLTTSLDFPPSAKSG